MIIDEENNRDKQSQTTLTEDYVSTGSKLDTMSLKKASHNAKFVGKRTTNMHHPSIVKLKSHINYLNVNGSNTHFKSGENNEVENNKSTFSAQSDNSKCNAIQQSANKNKHRKRYVLMKKKKKKVKKEPSVQEEKQLDIKTKYKLMKIPNGIEYIGRLNVGLSTQEINEDFATLEDTKITPSKSVVKLSFKDYKPKAKDTYFKIVYDRLRK